MSQNLESSAAAGAEPSELAGWLTQLQRYRLLGVVLVAVALIGAVSYLHTASYKYSAVLTVTPADQSGQQVGGNLAGLGSLVGIDIGGQTGSAFNMFAEAVVSYPVAERLSRNAPLMHAIFKASWDPVTKQWREPQSTRIAFLKSVKRLLGVPIKPWMPPDGHSLQNYIEDNVTVTEDKKKALVRLSYNNEDPAVAVALLKGMNAEADSFLRARSLERASSYIEYLERRLAEIQVVEYRLSMAQVLGNYEKTRMMASSDTTFAAEAFGDIWVSPNFTTPNPWIVLAAALVGSVALWLGLALVVLPMIAMVRRERAGNGVSEPL